MAELFYESPVTICVIGFAIVLVALITWINGGFKSALYAAVALALLTIVLLILSVRVKTDREQISEILNQVAEAVENNDVDKVLTYVHPGAVAGVLRVKSELPNYQFTEARITGVKSIQSNHKTNPPSGTAEFNVAVSLTGQGGQGNGIRRFVRCYFLYHNGRWLVHDYQHFDVAAGFREDAQ